MSNENDIRHGRHCVFLMHVHLVFVTKYRRNAFTKEILDDLRGIFVSVCADFEAELVEFDGEDGVLLDSFTMHRFPVVHEGDWCGEWRLAGEA